MAWETRNGKGHYYTRSRRVGGRVVRSYYGGGLVGEMIAREDQIARERRSAEGRMRRELVDRTTAVEESYHTLALRTRLLTRAALLAAGYHQHSRGEWRRRMAQDTNPTPQASTPAAALKTISIEELIRMANGGDDAARQRLRQYVKAHPEVFDGDLGNMAKRTWIQALSQGDFLLAESLSGQYDALRGELAGPKPSAAVRLLADQVAIGWLRSHYYDVLLGSTQHGNPFAKQVADLQKLQSRAQTQYADSLKELERVRALLAKAMPKAVVPAAAPKRRRKRRSAAAASRIAVLS